MSSSSSASPQQHDGAAGDASASASAPSAAFPSASGRGKTLADARVSEELEIALNLALERFWYSDDQEMAFPSSFTSTERAFAHRLCQSLGLISKSKGLNFIPRAAPALRVRTRSPISPPA